jgi:hypothetical protein
MGIGSKKTTDFAAQQSGRCMPRDPMKNLSEIHCKKDTQFAFYSL